jgi:hypothetical protein
MSLKGFVGKSSLEGILAQECRSFGRNDGAPAKSPRDRN